MAGADFAGMHFQPVVALQEGIGIITRPIIPSLMGCDNIGIYGVRPQTG